MLLKRKGEDNRRGRWRETEGREARGDVWRRQEETERGDKRRGMMIGEWGGGAKGRRVVDARKPKFSLADQ